MSSAPSDRVRESVQHWVRHMRRGDFEAAWRISDALVAARGGVPCSHLPRHFQYVWTGAPVRERRVLVRCYHGLGDTLQFIRYAAPLRRLAAEVIVWAQPELLGLLRTAPGVDRLLPLHDGTPEVDYDVDVELMELPHVFRTTLESVPRDVPYLHVEPVSSVRRPGLNVGVAWRVGEWDTERSMPVTALAPLAGIDGVVVHVLQRGPGLAERPEGFGLVSGSDDVLEAARVVRALDLLISVDSMPAHLAGALGVPVWNLLPAEANWRWMENREDSPWYPTMRLFRQSMPGAWEPVVERVREELGLLARRSMSQREPGGGR